MNGALKCLKKISNFIKKNANHPKLLENKIKDLSSNDFKKPYRPGGWQIAQLIHHIADSHTHNYIRFKQAILFDNPTIMDYKSSDWASTLDATIEDIIGSLQMIKGIHNRWSILLNSIKLEDLHRYYFHPNGNIKYPLHVALALYAWHGDHHLAQIENTL